MLTNEALEKMLNVYKSLNKATVKDLSNVDKGESAITWSNAVGNQIKTLPFSATIESGNIKNLVLSGRNYSIIKQRLSQQTPPNITYKKTYAEMFSEIAPNEGEVGIGFTKYGSKIYPFKLYVLSGITPNANNILGEHTQYLDVGGVYPHDPSEITQDSYDFVENIQGIDDSYNFIFKITGQHGSQYWLATYEAFKYTVGDYNKLTYDLTNFTSENLNLTKMGRFKFSNGITERLVKI